MKNENKNKDKTLGKKIRTAFFCWAAVARMRPDADRFLGGLVFKAQSGNKIQRFYRKILF